MFVLILFILQSLDMILLILLVFKIVRCQIQLLETTWCSQPKRSKTEKKDKDDVDEEVKMPLSALENQLPSHVCDPCLFNSVSQWETNNFVLMKIIIMFEN